MTDDEPLRHGILPPPPRYAECETVVAVISHNPPDADEIWQAHVQSNWDARDERPKRRAFQYRGPKRRVSEDPPPGSGW